MKRFDIINFYIRQRNFSSFLEIGTAFGETFRSVGCETKVSVDINPSTHPTFCMSSDEFFSRNKQRFDIVFVDGMHYCNQAWKDITNALGALNKGGIVVVHDCNPTDENMQRTDGTIPHFWTGDVWKAFVKARAELPYKSYTIPHDFGCGVIDTAKRIRKRPAGLPTDMSVMTWNDFVSHPEWMNFRDMP